MISAEPTANEDSIIIYDIGKTNIIIIALLHFNICNHFSKINNCKQRLAGSNQLFIYPCLVPFLFPRYSQGFSVLGYKHVIGKGKAGMLVFWLIHFVVHGYMK